MAFQVGILVEEGLRGFVVEALLSDISRKLRRSLERLGEGAANSNVSPGAQWSLLLRGGLWSCCHGVFALVGYVGWRSAGSITYYLHNASARCSCAFCSSYSGS